MSTFLENIPIADAHHHLWDLSHGIYPWLGDRPNESFFLGDYAAIRRNYLPHDYRADARGHNVAWTVHIEAEWDRNQQVRETEWLSSVAEQHGMPHVLVAHAWFDDPNIESVLEAHCEHPLVRGIRSKPARPGQAPHDVDEARGAMSDAAWRRGFALLRKYNLRWDLRVPVQQLPEAAQLCNTFEDTQVVLNHTGLSLGPLARRSGVLARVHADYRVLPQCLCETFRVWPQGRTLGLRGEPSHRAGDRRHIRRRPLHVCIQLSGCWAAY